MNETIVIIEIQTVIQTVIQIVIQIEIQTEIVTTPATPIVTRVIPIILKSLNPVTSVERPTMFQPAAQEVLSLFNILLVRSLLK